MNNFKCNQIHQTSGTGTAQPDVCTTDDLTKAVCLNAKNIPLAILPLFVQQYSETDESDCHSDSRVTMYRKYGISQGVRDGGANITEKILASLGFTDVTNIGGMHHYQ